MHLLHLVTRPKERQRVWREHKNRLIRIGVACAFLLLVVATVSWSRSSGSPRHADDDAIPLTPLQPSPRTAAIADAIELNDTPLETGALTKARRAARLRKRNAQKAAAARLVNDTRPVESDAVTSVGDTVANTTQLFRAPDVASPDATPEVVLSEAIPIQESDTLFIPPLSKEEQSLLEEAAERGGPSPTPTIATPVATPNDEPVMDAVAEPPAVVPAPEAVIEINSTVTILTPIVDTEAQVAADEQVRLAEISALDEKVAQAVPADVAAINAAGALDAALDNAAAKVVRRKDDGMTFTRTRSWRKSKPAAVEPSDVTPVAVPVAVAEVTTPVDADNEVRNLTIAWDFGACGCTGWAMEATGMMLGLAPFVSRLAIVAGRNCFCPGLPDADLQLLEEMRSEPVDEWDIDIWVSHKPPQRYPTFPYRGVVSVSREPLFIVGRSMTEVHRVPRLWADRIASHVDEVWLPSAHSLAPFTRAGVDTARMVIIPEPVDEVLYDPANTKPLDVDLSDREFNFLSVFKLEPRKGWKGLVRAFMEEFASHEPVTLTIHTYIFADGDPYNLRRIRERIDEFVDTLEFSGRNLTARPLPHDNLRVLSGQLSLERMPRLYRAFDAFVLPTHGEGWGLPLMEAMAMGLPAITTNWGGQLAFMNAANSFLLPLERFAPAQGSDFDQGAMWAVPDLLALRRAMRHLASRPGLAHAVGARARQDVVGNFNRGAVAVHILERLDALMPVIAARRILRDEGRPIRRGSHLKLTTGVHDPSLNVGMRARRGDASAEAEVAEAASVADQAWLDQVVADSRRTGWQGPRDPQHAYAMKAGDEAEPLNPPASSQQSALSESQAGTQPSEVDAATIDRPIEVPAPLQPTEVEVLNASISEANGTPEPWIGGISTAEEPAVPLAGEISSNESALSLAGGIANPDAPALPLAGGIANVEEPSIPLEGAIASAEEPALSLAGGIATADDPQPLTASIDADDQQQAAGISSLRPATASISTPPTRYVPHHSDSITPHEAAAAAAHIPLQTQTVTYLKPVATMSRDVPSLYANLDQQQAAHRGQQQGESVPRSRPLHRRITPRPSTTPVDSDEADIVFDHPMSAANLAARPVIQADPSHVEGRFTKRPAASQPTEPRTLARRSSSHSKTRATKVPTRVDDDEEEDRSSSKRRSTSHRQAGRAKTTRHAGTKKHHARKQRKARVAASADQDDEPVRPHRSSRTTKLQRRRASRSNADE